MDVCIWESPGISVFSSIGDRWDARQVGVTPSRTGVIEMSLVKGKGILSGPSGFHRWHKVAAPQLLTRFGIVLSWSWKLAAGQHRAYLHNEKFYHDFICKGKYIMGLVLIWGSESTAIKLLTLRFPPGLVLEDASSSVICPCPQTSWDLWMPRSRWGGWGGSVSGAFLQYYMQVLCK